MSDTVYPHVINHVGLNVPDLDAAFAWYRDVLGFQPMIPPIDVENGVGEPGKRLGAIAGPGFKKLRLAYMATGNGVGFEMFQFVDPPTERFKNDWEYWRPGIWHLSITDPDIEALLAKIIAGGGARHSDRFEVPAGSGMALVFAMDPWGNPIELMNFSFDRLIQAVVSSTPAAPAEGTEQ